MLATRCKICIRQKFLRTATWSRLCETFLGSGASLLCMIVTMNCCELWRAKFLASKKWGRCLLMVWIFFNWFLFECLPGVVRDNWGLLLHIEWMLGGYRMLRGTLRRIFVENIELLTFTNSLYLVHGGWRICLASNESISIFWPKVVYAVFAIRHFA